MASCSLFSLLHWLTVLAVLCMLGHVHSDFASDRAECTDQLIGLSTCLTFVQGGANARSPTPDCCSGLRQVVAKSFKCLCVLVKDKDELGLDINVTQALSLPSACSSPANVSDCPKLLKLPQNSAVAKIFYQYAERLKGTATNSNAKVKSTPTAQATKPSSDARRNRWLSLEKLGGVWLCSALSLVNLLVLVG